MPNSTVSGKLTITDTLGEKFRKSFEIRSDENGNTNLSEQYIQSEFLN